MYFWLYTTGRETLSQLICLLPLLCLLPAMPLATAAFMGADIRRNNATSQPGYISLRLVTHLIVSLALTATYVTLSKNLAIERSYSPHLDGFPKLLIGNPPPGINQKQLLTFSIIHLAILTGANGGLFVGLQPSGWLRKIVDDFNNLNPQRGEVGSAHFITPSEYQRFRRHDPDGITFFGAFWGQRHKRIDQGKGEFCLNSEDAARGVLTLGGPGSGKSQAVILPSIADAMFNGHSVIVGDPQGELKTEVLKFAKATGHVVVIHDPTSNEGPRFNLAENISTVAEARAIAGVLIPKLGGDNAFWSDSAEALLAACLLCFKNLGEIHSSLGNITQLAEKLQQHPTAALLANAFMASATTKDPKMASSIVATLSTALTGWADPEVQANTSHSDFNAEVICQQPTAVILTCPGRTREVYAKYLGAVITKLLQDLDSIGEANKDPKTKGQLPFPVNLILDEFPQLGRLERLVADVNLVRKRRIAIMIAAQTMGQFKMIYGQDGTDSLLAGLATQIVFGGCDQETAEFYSRASGTATHKIPGSNGYKDDIRQRPLLTADEVQAPAKGNATIFARYVEVGYALNTVIHTRLTRMYERQDWDHRIKKVRDKKPTTLTRINPTLQRSTSAPHRATPISNPLAALPLKNKDPRSSASTSAAIPLPPRPQEQLTENQAKSNALTHHKNGSALYSSEKETTAGNKLLTQSFGYLSDQSESSRVRSERVARFDDAINRLQALHDNDPASKRRPGRKKKHK